MGYNHPPDWPMPAGPPSTWTSEELEVHIHGCADSDRIQFANHRAERGQEREISQGDARRAAKYGRVTVVEKASLGFTGVKCKVSWKNQDDETIVVVVGVSDAKHDPHDPFITLITNY